MKPVGNISSIVIFFSLFLVSFYIYKNYYSNRSQEVLSLKDEHSYWLLLQRKSNKEFLYFGIPGKKDQSQIKKSFQVKAGTPDYRPTPLPSLLGRQYWIIIDKIQVADDPETAPYFLTLDIPVTGDWPYGPEPYLECNGQCDWVLPGYFGLHGVNGDETKLAQENTGSSGCIRHYDEDITFLYNLLNPKENEVRYYIEDT